MEVVRLILLVKDVNSGYWHSKFQADTISSIRWHVLMENLRYQKNPLQMKHRASLKISKIAHKYILNPKTYIQYI